MAAVGGVGVVARRSIELKNAASVLPLPVGAEIKVWSPPVIGGQPCTWAPVGSGKDAPNQARTAGENLSSTG